jgi:hypothetical protein
MIIRKATINDFKVIIASEKWFTLIEKVFQKNIEKGTRYSIKKDTKFDKKKLKFYVDNLDGKYFIKQIDTNLYKKIKNSDSFVTNLKMTENYEKYGIGFCALNDKYEIRYIQPYDMFPNTANVETLVVLDKKVQMQQKNNQKTIKNKKKIKKLSEKSKYFDFYDDIKLTPKDDW